MRSDAENKKWGTIYLGTNKEATLDSLDAMQASVQHDQWNQRTQNDYLNRVRERATDRAREILGAAHTERQNLLQEARTEAERIRLEAQVQYAKADEARAQAAATRDEAQSLHAEAETIRDAAQQEGFDHGLANARDELDAFRGAMGASIAVVLQAIERQNSALFAAWREEVVELVKTCVEKGTAWVLTSQYADVLRALVMESVRKLDNRHTVTLRVHPDDEGAVADMFAAAREAMPDVERWIVNGDPNVELGGLIAESFSSTVDNRVELRRHLVDSILQHLTLPEGEADVIAASVVHEIVQEQIAHIAEIAPPMPETPPAEADGPAPEVYTETFLEANPHAEALLPEIPVSPADFTNNTAMAEALLEADTSTLNDVYTDTVAEQTTDMAAELTPEPDEAAVPENNALEEMAASLRAAEIHAPEFAPALPDELTESPVNTDMNDIDDMDDTENIFTNTNSPSPSFAPEHLENIDDSLSSLEELERELLPLPEEQPLSNVMAENNPHLDEVLAGGGFISEPASTTGSERSS